MGKTPYGRALELECEQARERAEVFFWRLLAEATQMDRAKLLKKAPAALAAVCGLFSLLDGPDQHPAVAAAVLGTTRRLFDAEIEKACGKPHRSKK